MSRTSVYFPQSLRYRLQMGAAVGGPLCLARSYARGDWIAVARPDSWFTYYYWLDDRRAPDFARTVDIHRKPGYDPVELFLDPEIRVPALTVGWKLARKKLGFRNLLDVSATVAIEAQRVVVTLDKRAHNPLLVQSRLADTPTPMPWFGNKRLHLQFR